VLCFVCFGNFLTKLNTSAGKIADTKTATQATHVNNNAHNRQESQPTSASNRAPISCIVVGEVGMPVVAEVG
jgi:hypothetical protein